jgi:hypothetical protein
VLLPDASQVAQQLFRDALPVRHSSTSRIAGLSFEPASVAVPISLMERRDREKVNEAVRNARRKD